MRFEQRQQTQVTDENPSAYNGPLSAYVCKVGTVSSTKAMLNLQRKEPAPGNDDPNALRRAGTVGCFLERV